MASGTCQPWTGGGGGRGGNSLRFKVFDSSAEFSQSIVLKELVAMKSGTPTYRDHAL